MTTGSSVAWGWRTAADRGRSSVVRGEVIAGSRVRAAESDGPQLPSQQGIGALKAFSPRWDTQQEEHKAESGAARKAAPIRASTANRKRVIRYSNRNRGPFDSWTYLDFALPSLSGNVTRSPQVLEAQDFGVARSKKGGGSRRPRFRQIERVPVRIR